MREDEVFAATAVVGFLGGKASYSPGGDPPDFWLDIEGRTVALEVTQLSPFSFDVDGAPKNRRTEDEFSARLCDDLDEMLGDWVPNHIGICVVITGPILRPRKFRSGLRTCCEQFLAAGSIEPGSRELHEIQGNKIEIVAIPPRPSGKRVVGIIANENGGGLIAAEASAIISDRVLVKTGKMDDLDWEGPRWLALLNCHPLISDAEFAATYSRLGLVHDFERVLIVGSAGVEVVYES